ncbi:MAG: hypothetical protein ACE5JX_19230 [Acidobacteriota bacterium]
MDYIGKDVLVTTEHRGVFFGRLCEDNFAANVVIDDARNCFYWDQSVHGVLGLAAAGPNGSCRIGPSVESLKLHKITSICLVSDKAAEKWRTAAYSGRSGSLFLKPEPEWETEP